MAAAASDFGKAIELRPEAANVYLARASALFQLERLPGGIGGRRRCHPARPELGRCLHPARPDRGGARQADQAIADFTKAIALDPGLADAYRYRGTVRPRAAISTPRSPTSTSPSSVPRTLAPPISRAPTRWRKGTTRGGAARPGHGDAARPQQSRGLRQPGQCAGAAGQRRAGDRLDFDKAIALRPDAGLRLLRSRRVLTCWEGNLRPARRGLRRGAPARPEDGSRQEAAGECGSPRSRRPSRPSRAARVAARAPKFRAGSSSGAGRPSGCAAGPPARGRNRPEPGAARKRAVARRSPGRAAGP